MDNISFNSTQTDNESEESHLQHFHEELEAINQLNHPNIVKVFGLFYGDFVHPPTFISEYLKTDLLAAVSSLTEFQRVRLLIEICDAMHEVHKIGKIHGKLKPENILLDNEKHAKLSEIGFFKMNEIDISNVGIGTLRFIAPEFLNKQEKIDEKVDVFSFGIVAYFVLSRGQYPRMTIEDVIADKKIKIPKCINKISSELITKCLNNNSKERPSFEEIINYIKINNCMMIDGIENEIDKIKKCFSFFNE